MSTTSLGYYDNRIRKHLPSIVKINGAVLIAFPITNIGIAIFFGKKYSSVYSEAKEMIRNVICFNSVRKSMFLQVLIMNILAYQLCYALAAFLSLANLSVLCGICFEKTCKHNLQVKTAVKYHTVV